MKKTCRDIMALHDETMELLMLNSGNTEQPRLVRALLAIASPAAESMSDKQRIDEFVSLAIEAAGALRLLEHRNRELMSSLSMMCGDA